MQLFPGRAAYLLVVAVAVVDALWLGLSDLSLPADQLVEPALLMASLMILALLFERMAGFPEPVGRIARRIGCWMQGMAFLEMAWIAVRVFNHLSMSCGFAYADPLLSRWDSSLPVDWRAYFDFVARSPVARHTLDLSYTSLTFFSFVSFLVLMAQRDIRRARYFLEAFLVVAVICTTVGMFFPAKAAVATYLADACGTSGFRTLPGVYHLAHLERLRAGEPFAFDLGSLPGLVTFPSFHTAAGVVLAASFLRTWLFPAVAAYGAIMIAATPVFGGHYFVDLIAGAAVAVVVLRLFAALPHYRGMVSGTGGPTGAPAPVSGYGVSTSVARRAPAAGPCARIRG